MFLNNYTLCPELHEQHYYAEYTVLLEFRRWTTYREQSGQRSMTTTLETRERDHWPESSPGTSYLKNSLKYGIGKERANTVANGQTRMRKNSRRGVFLSWVLAHLILSISFHNRHRRYSFTGLEGGFVDDNLMIQTSDYIKWLFCWLQCKTPLVASSKFTSWIVQCSVCSIRLQFWRRGIISICIAKRLLSPVQFCYRVLCVVNYGSRFSTPPWIKLLHENPSHSINRVASRGSLISEITLDWTV